MHHINIQINDRVKPDWREILYEKPLQSFLEKNNAGEVIGGGTLQKPDGEMEHVDVQLDLTSLEILPEIQALLERRGIPIGSEIQYVQDGKDRTICLGNFEGYFLYLDGISLGKEVYEHTSCDELFDLIIEKLEGNKHGVFHDFWQGPRESAFYIFGKSANIIEERLAEIVATYPLCKNARIVKLQNRF